MGYHALGAIWKTDVTLDLPTNIGVIAIRDTLASQRYFVENIADYCMALITLSHG